jgi:hypothetical protein
MGEFDHRRVQASFAGTGNATTSIARHRRIGYAEGMVQIVSRQATLERRECGDCGMCCKLFHIPAVEKSAGKWRWR